jgi:GNAT superfamily N-acetyltransferase
MERTNSVKSKGIPYVIERLGPAKRDALRAHFVTLDDGDRALRFGVAADDAIVARYVDGIDFARGAVLGAVARDGALAAVAHIALHGGVAELGLSVLPSHRSAGVGRALAAAALREAERMRASELRIHCAATNRGMRRIAEALKMEIAAEGSDVTARRRLAAAAPASSRGPARIAPRALAVPVPAANLA